MPHEARLPFNPLIRDLPSTAPFIGPEALERQQGRPFTLRLGANESLLGPSPRAIEAVRAAVPQVALYGDPENMELRQAISDQEGVDVERIVVSAGIDDLLGLLIRVLLNPGDIAVTTLGAYPTVSFHLHGFGARIEQIPYAGLYNDLEAIGAAARRVEARLAYLANPDNPTGTFVDGEAVTRLLHNLPENCAFLLDEAYTEFAPSSCRQVAPADDPRLIRLRTFSKAYGLAGARVGYAIAPVAVARMIEKVRLHFGVNRLAQIAALAAYRDHAYLDTVVAEVAQGRQEYAALGRELGLPPAPSATNFVAFDAGSTERAQALAADLGERNVFIRRPTIGPTYLIRVTVADSAGRLAFATRFRAACEATAHLAVRAS
ncbi:MAG TPA: aminotransferase class I/II-fold pyridoxal phosphate-dependent enzyme [Ktedonobacterales bacterium]